MTGAAGAEPAAETWRVPEGAAGERLDRHVAARLALPRNQVQQLIRDGRVQLGGRDAKASAVLAGGETIACRRAAPSETRVLPEPGALDVLYEDADLVVLDKPAGLSVHPGAGRQSGTLAHRLLARYPEMAGVGGPGRPGIVHRLDLGTTGAMVVARTAAAYAALSRDFAARRVKKEYLAVCYGAPQPRAGTIEAPIARHRERRQEMTVAHGGRPARTDYRTLAAPAGRGIALLHLDLGTGRTHQIRVHLKSRGHPLVGDPVYGEARWRALPRPQQPPLRDFPRPALHAWRLTVHHPQGDRELHFTAGVPADLRQLWEEVTGAGFPDVEKRPAAPTDR
ncbi:MAG TPA: RluA family pseudouridine synthase [Thermoanaerobaculia bacterium]